VFFLYTFVVVLIDACIMRKVWFLFLFFSLILIQAVNSQRVVAFDKKLPYMEVFGIIPYGTTRGTVYTEILNGDTIPLILLKTVYVFPPENFRNKKEEKYYWKLVRDIKVAYPLSKIVFYTLLETMDYMESLPDEKSRQKHLRRMEKDLVKEYEKTIRKMTYNQGKILIKLIDRECNVSSYELIRAYRGSFTAGLWQGVAKLFKANLKDQYDEGYKDLLIERIIIKIEQGQL
jgi:hypothetical protein